MKGNPEERAVQLGEYITETGATVRSAAKAFGISKSTVHKDITYRLEKQNHTLYDEVQKVLRVNKEERHLRGGRGDGPEAATFWGRIKRAGRGGLEPYGAWAREVSLPGGQPPPFAKQNPGAGMFFIRMLYSCLVAADFLDTEAFMSGKPRGSCSGCWKKKAPSIRPL